MRTLLALALILTFSGCATAAEVSPGATDHYVKLKSSAPGMSGGETSVYVREVAASSSSSISKSDRVVIFVHGGIFAGSPVFDLPHSDYSWMRYFAAAGYDTFAIEFTGYGRSTRPPPMDDPCNLSQEQQKQFIPVLIAGPCKPSVTR